MWSLNRLLRETIDMPTDPITSRWWYGVALQPVTTLLFIGLFALVGTGILQTADAFSDTVKFLLLVVVGIPLIIVVIGGFIGGPLFPVALFMDAKAVRRADLEWKPNPYLYAILGLTQLMALAGSQFGHSTEEYCFSQHSLLRWYISTVVICTPVFHKNEVSSVYLNKY
jgi:uncharacterized integral membrane protein